jgi:hypothetical protein
MFGKEKGPTRKTHEEHATEAWRQLQSAKVLSAENPATAKANAHAVLAIYTLLNERLPVRERPAA